MMSVYQDSRRLLESAILCCENMADQKQFVPKCNRSIKIQYVKSYPKQVK